MRSPSVNPPLFLSSPRQIQSRCQNWSRDYRYRAPRLEHVRHYRWLSTKAKGRRCKIQRQSRGPKLSKREGFEIAIESESSGRRRYGSRNLRKWYHRRRAGRVCDESWSRTKLYIVVVVASASVRSVTTFSCRSAHCLTLAAADDRMRKRRLSFRMGQFLLYSPSDLFANDLPLSSIISSA